MSFQIKAQAASKTQLKARLAFDGPSGAGKTYTALVAATALAGEGGRICVIDTERGSAQLYADYFKFETVTLPLRDDKGREDPRGFSPVVYVEAIEALQDIYDVLVIDSLSHAWEGKGGALEQVDMAAAKSKGNSYVAWRSVTPVHNKLVDAMLQAPCHIVTTMRSKMDYLQQEVNGKKVIQKVGMAPIQRQGMEYEFTMIGDMDTDHRVIISKSRCKPMADRQAIEPGVDFFVPFVEWLSDGQAAPIVPKPQPAEVETVPGTSIPTSDINPDYTWANLLKYAKRTHQKSEEDVKAALKEKGFTTYTADKHIAARAVLDQAFAKPVEPEVEPDFMKEPAA